MLTQRTDPTETEQLDSNNNNNNDSSNNNNNNAYSYNCLIISFLTATTLVDTLKIGGGGGASFVNSVFFVSIE